MRNIGENEITNMGGDFNYINCECISEISAETEVTLTLDSNTGKYYLEGISTQNGTPTPENPIEIVNTYKAGHYKTTIGGTTYRFSLGDDLRSIGNVKDRLELDITNRIGNITKKIRNINKLIANMNIADTYPGWKNVEFIKSDLPNINTTFRGAGIGITSNITIYDNGIGLNTTGNNSMIFFVTSVFGLTETQWKENYGELTFDLNYSLYTPTTESVEVD